LHDSSSMQTPLTVSMAVRRRKLVRQRAITISSRCTTFRSFIRRSSSVTDPPAVGFIPNVS
jgi:hypothetical protein